VKIALIYDAVYPWMKGGGEKALWEMSVFLARKGHDVHLYSEKLWEGPAALLKEGVTLHGVGQGNSFYRADGKRSFLQPIRFGISLFSSLWSGKERNFDLIFCTVFPYYSVFAVWLYRRLRERKSALVLAWLEVWGVDYWKSYVGPMKGAVGAGIEWLSSRCSRRHLVISPMQKRRLVHLLGISTDEIEVIPRGLEGDSYANSPAKTRGRVLYTGRLIDYKNLATVIRAWPLVMAQMPSARFRIIGAGPEQEKLCQLILDMGVSESVEILPPVETHEEIVHAIGSADILVQPSLREGQGVTVLEAMAAGTLVMASRHENSAVSDLIISGINGILVSNPLDPEEWSFALGKHLKDSVSRESMVCVGKKGAMAYDWQKVLIPRLEAYFKEAAATTFKQKYNEN